MEQHIKYENIDFPNVCRICFTKKDKMTLICEAGLADMLVECASIEVTPENGLYNPVCDECSNEITKWHTFRRRVIRAFEIGRYILEQKASLTLTTEIFSNQNVFTRTSETSFSPVSKIFPEGGKFTVPEKMCPISKDSNEECTLKNLRCRICGKECSTINSYNHHTKFHDTLRLQHVCNKCGKSFKTSQVLSDHLKRHYNDRRYRCKPCGQTFYAKANLIDHVRSHSGEKPFKCNICERTFGTKPNLTQHQIVHSIRENKFKCDICNKYLLTAGSLVIHKRKHSGVRPFICSACDKRFFTKETMQRHFAAIHDTDNNFLCSVCPKLCSTKFHLNNHMKKKHMEIGKSSNTTCLHCGKQCGSPAELKVHVRVHTGERPYLCHICNKRFIAKGNLNSHIHRHTGNKPFLCNHCGKAFGEKSTLKVHERIHTGEQPFKCKFCAKSYIQSSALQSHLKQHLMQ